jgi:glycosyltransferase involved in cell wall biosynthesis
MKNDEGCYYSIVIPCYNEANYICNCLKSLTNQETDLKYEIIVVDNNSTDNSIAIIKQNFPQVKIIEERRPGVCFARQAGTDHAQGDIIISTDSDTVFKKNWLNNIDQAFRKNQKIIAVTGPCQYYDGPWWGKVYTRFFFTADYLYSLIFKRPFYVTATNLAFKKTFFKGYNLIAMQGGDELHVLKQLKNFGQIKFLYNNKSLTSGRRLEKGLYYTIFVSFIYYYLIAYYVNNRFKREVIGTAPAFRFNQKIKMRPRLGYGLIVITFLIAVSTVSTTYRPARNFIANNIKDTSANIERIIRHLT